MLKLKKLLTEWNDTSFRNLPKRWSKPVMKGREPDGLTEFERLGGTDVELGKVILILTDHLLKLTKK